MIKSEYSHPTIETILQKSSFNHAIKNIRTDVKKIMLNADGNNFDLNMNLLATLSSNRTFKINQIKLQNRQKSIYTATKNKNKPLLPPTSSKSLNQSKDELKVQQNKRVSISQKHRRDDRISHDGLTHTVKDDCLNQMEIKFQSQKKPTSTSKTGPTPNKISRFLFEISIPQHCQEKINYKLSKFKIVQCQQQKYQNNANQLGKKLKTFYDKSKSYKSYKRKKDIIPEFIKPSLQLYDPQTKSQKNNNHQHQHFNFDDKAIQTGVNHHHFDTEASKKPKCIFKSKKKQQKNLQVPTIQAQVSSQPKIQPKVGPLKLQQKYKIDKPDKNYIDRYRQTISQGKPTKPKVNTYIQDINLCGWQLNENQNDVLPY